MDWKPVTISDTFIILATIIGPVIAVQLQKFIEKLSQQRNKRTEIFETLMATRAVRSESVEHVRALNLIDLYFDRNSSKDKSVLEAWKIYLDNLSSPLSPNPNDAIPSLEKSKELLTDLLYAMSKSLGYDFDKVQIKRGAYHPRGQYEEIAGRQIIRDDLVRLARGEVAVPVIVYPRPSNERPDQSPTS